MDGTICSLNMCTYFIDSSSDTQPSYTVTCNEQNFHGPSIYKRSPRATAKFSGATEFISKMSRWTKIYVEDDYGNVSGHDLSDGKFTTPFKRTRQVARDTTELAAKARNGDWSVHSEMSHAPAVSAYRKLRGPRKGRQVCVSDEWSPFDGSSNVSSASSSSCSSSSSGSPLPDISMCSYEQYDSCTYESYCSNEQSSNWSCDSFFGCNDYSYQDEYIPWC